MRREQKKDYICKQFYMTDAISQLWVDEGKLAA